ncbi:glycosyltransferase family 2 protein [Lacisediminihabitans sp.]|uniref:glycosyltransferase family 2 protein n=1 Tax=Lacisediminihabitans sp. TaxID=2787631 RepID=UPI00374DA374
MGGEPSVTGAGFAALLLDSGLITNDQLAIARAAKSKTGDHLDEVLVNLGMVDSTALLKVMARAWKVAPLDLTSTRIDRDLVRQWPAEQYLRENWVPVRDQSNGSVLVATAREPDAARSATIASVLESPVEFVAATSWDIRSAVKRSFKAEIPAHGSTDRWRTNPSLSARVVVSNGQVVGGILFGLALFCLALVAPSAVVAAVVATASAAFLAASTFVLVMAVRGERPGAPLAPDAPADRIVDDLLPHYTVLVPVFRQAAAVPQMIATLSRLDYPADRLEVLILVEEEDRATRDSIIAAGPPPRFRIVTVPAGAPETRPRACNVGLFVARGEFLVVYGADHVPAPDQLRRAVAAFAHGEADLACVQASIRYPNASENALTRMVALERSSWADRVLPALGRSHFAVPAGGASEHFRTAALIELGGWDPYNVSEDVDLGVRMSAMGHRLGHVASTTEEPAAATVPAFIRQRSRWTKGYLQTALVHSRRPLALIDQLGFPRFAGTALFVAVTPVAVLMVIPFYLLVVAAVVLPADLIDSVLPAWALVGGIAAFALGMTEMIVVSAFGPVRRGDFASAALALLAPIHWILHSVAAYKGLGQLFTRPHYWEKTDSEPRLSGVAGA